MAHFKFVVTGQKLTLTAAVKGISDSLNINSAEFEFRTPEWDGAYKIAHFSNPGYNDGYSYDFALMDDKITEDAGLNLPTGVWEVYVHGDFYTDDEVTRRVVTESRSIQIVPSGIINGEPLPSLNSSTGEYVIGLATEALDAKIVGATAEVDVYSGTPSVEVDITGQPKERIINFSFHNLKGQTTVFSDPNSDGNIVVTYS